MRCQHDLEHAFLPVTDMSVEDFTAILRQVAETAEEVEDQVAEIVEEVEEVSEVASDIYDILS